MAGVAGRGACLVAFAAEASLRGEYAGRAGEAAPGPPEGVMVALAFFCLVGLALVLLLAATERR